MYMCEGLELYSCSSFPSELDDLSFHPLSFGFIHSPWPCDHEAARNPSLHCLAYTPAVHAEA